MSFDIDFCTLKLNHGSMLFSRSFCIWSSKCCLFQYLCEWWHVGCSLSTWMESYFGMWFFATLSECIICHTEISDNSWLSPRVKGDEGLKLTDFAWAWLGILVGRKWPNSQVFVLFQSQGLFSQKCSVWLGMVISPGGYIFFPLSIASLVHLH